MNSGTVMAVDEAHAGNTATIFTGGSYSLRSVQAGLVTLSASVEGHRTIEKTLSVDGDTRVDFALPRVSMSPVPALGGTWASYFSWSRGVFLAEFKLVQSGTAVSGTWSVPVHGYEGTIKGAINSERTFVGGMTLTRPCLSSADIGYGVLDYPEQVLTLGVTFACLPDHFEFMLDRRCRITSIPGLSCQP
ncbi:MAG: carboxypeptidase-like regulatory domain-containing protein [Vicinamibacterales bacterium]